MSGNIEREKSALIFTHSNIVIVKDVVREARHGTVPRQGTVLYPVLKSCEKLLKSRALTFMN